MTECTDHKNLRRSLPIFEFWETAKNRLAKWRISRSGKAKMVSVPMSSHLRDDIGLPQHIPTSMEDLRLWSDVSDVEHRRLQL